MLTGGSSSLFAEALYDLTLSCSGQLLTEHDGDTRVVFRIIQDWAEEFDAWWDTLPEEEQEGKDYALEIDKFAIRKLGGNPYWPAVRQLQRFFVESTEPGAAILVSLPNTSEIYAVHMVYEHHAALLLCRGFEGTWHKAVIVPEDEFETPSRVLDALVYMDALTM